MAPINPRASTDARETCPYMIKHLSLSSKILIIISLPILVLVFMGTSSGLDRYGTLRKYDEIRDGASTVRHFGALIHELQKERGRSATFIGTKGSQFGNELTAQRAETDERFHPIQDWHATLGAGKLNGNLGDLVKKAFANLEQLQSMRASIDSLKVPAAESTSYYTQTIASIIAINAGFAANVDDVRIANEMASYVDYLQVKEQTGIERATLAGVFAADRFSGDAQSRLVTAISAQDVYFAVFKRRAVEALVSRAEELSKSPIFESVDQMRQVALAKSSTGGFGIESAKWFEAASAKIDLMKQLEEQLADTYQDSVVKKHSAATQDLIVISVSVLATLVVTLGVCLISLKKTRRTLDRVISHLHSSSSEASDTSAQVASASVALADDASKQAAALEETSAALEEMSSMTKRNSESSKAAKDSAGQARVVAEKGAEQMKAMENAMQAISTASSEIASILKTIDEIAFQTNILALNAAVEAARAGEAGAGFAVVAEEVRALAQRSALAAKETAGRIEDSVAKSHQGAQISKDVAASFSEIHEHIKKMDEVLIEITTASVEQSQGIGEVTNAVSEMDQVTQANAARAEESAAAAELLNTQATKMLGAVAELDELVQGSNAGEEDHSVSSPGKKFDREFIGALSGAGVSQYQEQITKALSAHGMWKTRLKSAIQSGTSDITPERAALDNCCDFGKWLYSLPGREQECDAFREAKKLHANFHQEASGVLRLALGGKRDQAMRCVAVKGSFWNASERLASHMSSWKDALDQAS